MSNQDNSFLNKYMVIQSHVDKACKNIKLFYGITS